jgi:hypothetical protein
MDISINKSQLLGRILEMMDKQHGKIDAAGTVTQGTKDKVDGFLEALYQVENLVLNWGMETGANN